MDWSLDTADAPALSDARRDFIELLERHGQPGSEVTIARFAFDELVGNVCRHAPGKLWIGLDWDRSRPVLHVRDHGPGFVLAEALSRSSRGGLGILADLAGPLQVSERRADGADVSVTLPVHRKEAPPATTGTGPALPAPEEVGTDGSFDREAFLRAIVVQLAQTVEQTHGPAAAQAAVDAVGARVGERIEQEHRRAHQLTEPLTASEISDLLVGLTAAVGGDFYPVSVTDERIVLGNRACPFGDVVTHAPALCHMTSSVFSGIAARNTGHGHADIEQRIALGDRECRVSIALSAPHRPDSATAGEAATERPARVRAVLAEDTPLLGNAFVQAFADAGVDVQTECDTPQKLMAFVTTYRPDVAIVDLREDQTSTALAVACHIRQQQPATGVLVLTESIEVEAARDLLRASPTGVGYLLKNKLGDVRHLLDAVCRVAEGGTVVDPDVLLAVARLERRPDPLVTLSSREREVLGLMAEGTSNDAIADELVVTKRAVEKHVSNIFSKLQLSPTPENERRVIAALMYHEAAQDDRPRPGPSLPRAGPSPGRQDAVGRRGARVGWPRPEPSPW